MVQPNLVEKFVDIRVRKSFAALPRTKAKIAGHITGERIGRCVTIRLGGATRGAESGGNPVRRDRAVPPLVKLVSRRFSRRSRELLPAPLGPRDAQQLPASHIEGKRNVSGHSFSTHLPAKVFGAQEGRASAPATSAMARG